MSERITRVNNFLFTCNLIAGAMALALLVVIAPGALFGSGVGSEQELGAAEVIRYARPLAVLALLCPLLACVFKASMSPSLGVKVQPMLLVGTACFSVLAVRCVLAPLAVLLTLYY